MIPCYSFQKKKLMQSRKHVSIELDKIQCWLDVNKLSLNVSKTKYIIISSKLNPLNVNVPILVHHQFMTEMQMSQFWYIPF